MKTHEVKIIEVVMESGPRYVKRGSTFKRIVTTSDITMAKMFRPNEPIPTDWILSLTHKYGFNKTHILTFGLLFSVTI